MMNKTIMLKKPAESFKDGFPLGNGTLAAMAMAGGADFKLALNHEWLWSTEGKSRTAPQRAEYLDEVRETILGGDYKRGTELANKYFSGVKRRKNRLSSYLPAGELNIHLETGEITGFSRKLCLERGFTETVFKDSLCGAVTQTAFVDFENSVGAVCVSCENEAEMTVSLFRGADPKVRVIKTAESEILILRGVLPEDYSYGICCRIISADKGTASDGKFEIKTNRLIVFFNIFIGNDELSAKEKLFGLGNDFEGMLMSHSLKFKTALGASELEIEETTVSGDTGDRLKAFKNGKDKTIPVLFWNYAKYLMVSGSSGELPLNLQGKWNGDLEPIWHCDYHFDINLQMNYWIAPILGMSAQEKPLFDYIERCAESAELTAKNLYGCRGMCFVLCGDAWGCTTPESYGWDVWIGAAPWLAAHFYTYYEYTGDTDFLRTHAYPFLKKTAQFIEDYLVYDGDKAVIVPSCSPENHFEESGDLPISICKNCVMDITLFRETLSNAAAAADILKTDKSEADKWRKILKKLPEISAGKSGRLLEWDDEYTEWEKGHRHFSNLYGLYPGNQIKAGGDLAEAARKSLEYRLENGSGQSGWSRSWVICLYARLRDGKNAWKHLNNLICDHITASMLDLHPPCPGKKEWIFQIDGNMGGAAGICEMLLYSETGKIELLPALPEEWKTGSFKSFKAKGNITVDAEWENGKIKRIALLTPTAQEIDLLFNQSGKRISLCANKVTEIKL